MFVLPISIVKQSKSNVRNPDPSESRTVQCLFKLKNKPAQILIQCPDEEQPPYL